MSGSKTKYYVSSSTFPMFDDSSRVNQYAAAMLDYTANSPIEHSEYIKSFYNTSRLRNYRGYLNWCEKNGFYSTFGRVEADFYGDAKLDNSVVADAIKHLINLNETDIFGVYQTNLSFFSEDFYIKYLATQQGLINKFYADGDLNYTISYPTNSSIRATLEDGTFIEGKLPVGSSNTRFIEISYSIIREIKEEYYPPEEDVFPEEGETPENNSANSETIKTETDLEVKEDADDLPLDPEEPIEPEVPEEPEPEPEPPKPIVITKYVYDYGFYHYQEGTGNTILDSLIKNNNVKVEKSFFPPIPLRSDTAWFKGEKEQKINDVLKYLEIKNTNSDGETGYEQLKIACSNMEKGSISDIDYITILLGTHLNSDNNSDQKYIFEFFYNLYFNYALKVARPDPSIAKTLYSGSNHIGEFASYAKKGFADSGYSDGYFTKFKINCAASNLNLTYSWGHSDYFEQNGKWKPDAKVGDYGVLSGDYVYSYSISTQEHATDNEGSYLYQYIDTDGDGETDTAIPVYETVTYHYKTPYTLTAFCKQTSYNRFKMVLFIDLKLTNLIYHGKTVETSAFEAISAASGKEDVLLSFAGDVGEKSEYSSIVFKRVTVTGEIDTPFIVPLEKNTFYEVGVKTQADIAPCSMFLIYNCYQKVKQKWYQRGFFKWVSLAIAVVVAIAVPGPGTSWAFVFYTAVAAAVVIAVSIAIDVLTKVLSAILGERIGGQIGALLQSTWQSICAVVIAVCDIVGTYAPHALAIKAGITIGMTVNNTDAALQNSESFGSAFLKGAGQTAVSIGAAYAAGEMLEFTGGSFDASINIGKDFSSVALNTSMSTLTANQMAATMATFSGISSFGGTLLETGSVKDALTAGFTSAAIAAASVYIFEFFDPKGFAQLTKDLAGTKTYSLELSSNTLIKSTESILTDSIENSLKNPNTYANLLGKSQEVYFEHRLKNLESDYQEFTNNLQAANDMLDVLNASMDSVITAQYICKWSLIANRFTSVMPELMQHLSPEQFITTSLLSGTDMCKTVLGSVTNFSENKLTMRGYHPSTLYYTQTDNTILWDLI